MNKQVAKPRAPNDASAVPIEDDERHSTNVDDYIARNRYALNASIRQSRKEIAEGTVSLKTIDDIIAEGRQRRRK
jgi:flagellar motility protein MotE (MotC chaperone)